jgi:hypothetical protein
MKKRILVPLLASIALVQTAAGKEASKPEFASAPPADANLYIVRQYAEPKVWNPTIKVDGKKIVALGNRRYTAIRLPPGRYHVTFRWPLIATQQGGSIDVEIVGNEPHYLFITGISQYAGGYGGSMSFRTGSGMFEAVAEKAAPVVAECCQFVPAK